MVEILLSVSILVSLVLGFGAGYYFSQQTIPEISIDVKKAKAMLSDIDDDLLEISSKSAEIDGTVENIQMWIEGIEAIIKRVEISRGVR